jgi:hypothetical protein
VQQRGRTGDVRPHRSRRTVTVSSEDRDDDRLVLLV